METVMGYVPFKDVVSVKIALTKGATVPQYMTYGSSGFDIASLEHIAIPPRSTVSIRTGITMEIPTGYELQIRPRSGLSLRSNLRVIIGTIDSDYRGEIKVICENIGNEFLIVEQGDRIAQGVIAPVVTAVFSMHSLEDLSQTKRGVGGFGHTGVGDDAK